MSSLLFQPGNSLGERLLLVTQVVPQSMTLMCRLKSGNKCTIQPTFSCPIHNLERQSLPGPLSLPPFTTPITPPLPQPLSLPPSPDQPGLYLRPSSPSVSSVWTPVDYTVDHHHHRYHQWTPGQGGLYRRATSPSVSSVGIQGPCVTFSIPMILMVTMLYDYGMT